jgi:hypothetical protein
VSRIRRGAHALVATVAIAAVVVPAAEAAEIPKGDYVCFLSGGGAGGSIQIKRDNKYTINKGKKGKYTFSRKHKVVNFKSGDYKGFFGEYVKADAGIDIYDMKSGDYLWSCYRD